MSWGIGTKALLPLTAMRSPHRLLIGLFAGALALQGCVGVVISSDDEGLSAPAPPRVRELESRETPEVREAPAGEFTIHLAGQVIADAGIEAFVLEGELVIEAPGDRDARNSLSVTLRTHEHPGGTLTLPCAILLETNPDGRDVLDVFFSGQELFVTGPLRRTAPFAGRFKTAEDSSSSFNIQAAFLRLNIQGDRVTGELFISSQPLSQAELLIAPEYTAHFTGERL